MENVNPEVSKKFDSVVWKLIMYRGVALLIVGLILTFFPESTLTALVFIMGVYWLVDGIITIYKSIQGRKIYSEWSWGLFTGILSTIAGLVVVFQPTLTSVLTTSFIVWFLGISAVLFGISGLITGIKLPKETRGRINMIIGAVFSLLIGILLISSPYTSVITLMKTIGIIALIGGISVIFVALGVKKKNAQ